MTKVDESLMFGYHYTAICFCSMRLLPCELPVFAAGKLARMGLWVQEITK